MHPCKKMKVNHLNEQDVGTSESEPEDTEKSTPKRKKKRSSSEKSAVEQVACYKCKYCLFLSLSQDAVASHVKQEHGSQIPKESNAGMLCPGCTNIFYSLKSLRVHLSEDHNVAQEELENIIKTFDLSLGVNGTPDYSETISKEDEQTQVSFVGDEQAEIFEDSTPDGNSTQRPLKRPRRRSARGAQKQLDTGMKKGIGKNYDGDMIVTKGFSQDETGKIRVRKMSSLEKSEQGASAATLGMQESSVASDICLTEENVDKGNSPKSVQYDIESIQILDIPLAQVNESEEQVVQELSGDDQPLLSVVDVNERKPQSVTASSSCCEAIIDEISQGDVLDNVLYLQGSELTDDQGSPIMVCFAASPNDLSGTEGYSIELDEDISLESGSAREEYLGDTFAKRMILTNCNSDGTVFIGSDGKKLVKRGYVKRSPPKRDRSKKANILRKQSSNINSPDDELMVLPRGVMYKCTEFGCSVRLLAHNNMQYHQRCHAPLDEPENSDKDTSPEVQGTRKGRKGRVPLGKSSFECPECSIRKDTWKQMKGHLWKYHSIDMELFSCSQCDYKTPSLSHMRNIHARIHGSEKPFLCDTCGKGFKTTKQLRNHKIIHERRDDTMHLCKICSRSFHTNRMLRCHIDTVHNKVRPYMCSACGHTAANRSSLKMHLRQHTGDRPYSCDQCEYSTSDHNSLRRHKKRHTGDKPYKCPYCPYACIQSTTYKIHLRSKHPGQDSGLLFSCKKCPFHSVSHDIYLAHTAEHDVAEACGLPLKGTHRDSQKRASKKRKGDRNLHEAEVPIFVSIAATDADEDNSQPNFENIVQHVSEAIMPGSNLHVLYNSISLPDSSGKVQIATGGSVDRNTLILRSPMLETVDYDPDDPELELVAEVQPDADAILEMPSEEIKLKLQDKKLPV